VTFLKSLLSIGAAIAIVGTGVVAAPLPALASPATLTMAAADPTADFALITQRMQQQFLEEGDQFQIASLIYLAKVSEAESYASSLQADGSWTDVNYADTTSSANTAVWQPYLALYRMVAMAEAYGDPSNAGYQDPKLIDALNRSLVYWDSVNPQSSNWWENEIGKSMAMGRLAIFVGPLLSPAALAVDYKENTGVQDPVGANGSWRTANFLMKAVSQQNVANVTAGLATLQKTVAVDNSGGVNEAVQPDSSLWVHGEMLYNEWYGMSLFQTIAAWADATRGTEFTFSRSALDGISTFILDGTRWMIRGNFGLMITLYKEPMSFQGVTSAASAFLLPLERMVRADPLNSSAYQQLVDNIKGDSLQNGVTGDKYFWRGEFSSHITNDYSIMTRLNSSRSKGGEYRSIYRPAVGNEMYWSAEGATAIQVNNHEYTDLGPAYDWLHYPGTTAPVEKAPYVAATSNNGSFTGGVSNGSDSVSVQSLDQMNTKASKSYFQFDNEMVALGTGISSTESVEVDSTVDQAISSPNATVNGQPIAVGTDTDMSNVTWAYNDEVGYVFPQAGGAAIHVSNAAQSGSYTDTDPTETHDAYKLYFDHGVKPTDASYEYIVVPAQSAAAVQAYSQNPSVHILQNDAQIQAVTDPTAKQTMAVFYSAGTLSLGNGSTLTVDKPSLVMLDQSGATPVVSVSSPDQVGIDVNVTLDQSGVTADTDVKLGSGANAYKTVTQPLVPAPVVVDNPNYTASTVAAGSSAGLAGDNDAATFWRSTGTDYQWLQYQLAPSSMLSHVDLTWAGTGYAKQFVVQSSTDGSTWTDLYTENAGTGAPVSVDIPPTPAKYVRVLALKSNDGSGYSVSSLTATASVNLALLQPAKASGTTSPYSASLAVDGDLTTGWRGPAAPGAANDKAWLEVDLGTSQALTTARLVFGDNPPATYKIQVSTDDTNWTDVYTSPAGTGGTQIVALPAGTQGRYVRVQGLTRLGTQAVGVTVQELELYGDTAIQTAVSGQVPGTRPNLALNAPTTSDSNWTDNSQQVKFATDGNYDTRWASARTASHQITVDLGKKQSVNQVHVQWESATATTYTVQVSDDNSTWTTVATVTKPVTQLTDTVNFPDVQARYVKLSGNAATGYGWSIYEFEVYGGDYLSCPATSTVLANQSDTVTATLAPITSGDQVTATSLDPSIVTIDGSPILAADGTVTVNLTTGDSGTAGIRLTHADGTADAICQINVTANTTSLQALVGQVQNTSSVDYTPQSWAPVNTAYMAAIATLAKGVIQQTEADADLAALQTAMSNVVARADKTALTAAIDAARSVQPTIYTQASYGTLTSALAAALAVDNNADQADVDAATSVLVTAQAGLETIADLGSKALLGTVLTAIGGLSQSAYTPTSWSAYQSAVTGGEVAKAQAVFDDPDASESAVTDHTSTLQAALNVLVLRADTAALDTEILAVAGLDQTAYTPTSWGVLADALVEANALDGDSSQVQVDAVLQDITVAEGELLSLADKAALQSLVDQGRSLSSTSYTPNSWLALSPAIDGAATVLADANSTGPQVLAVAQQLQAALSALVLRADTTALAKALSEAATKSDPGNNPGAWRVFVNALAAARALDPNSSQSAVDSAVAALTAAMAVLAKGASSGISDGSLAYTGTDIGPAVLLALALLLSGAVLAVVWRRRKRLSAS
jgi:hypothetical protein